MKFEYIPGETRFGWGQPHILPVSLEATVDLRILPTGGAHPLSCRDPGACVSGLGVYRSGCAGVSTNNSGSELLDVCILLFDDRSQNGIE